MLCGRSHYVHFVKTHRLICNMTNFGDDITLSARDLRSNLEIDLLRSIYICMIQSVLARETDGAKIMVAILISQKLFTNDFLLGRAVLGRAVFYLWLPL